MEHGERERPVGRERHRVEPTTPGRVLPGARRERGQIRVRVHRVTLEVVGQVLEQRLDRVREPGDLVDFPVRPDQQVRYVPRTEYGAELVRVRVAVLEARVHGDAELGVHRVQVGVTPEPGWRRSPPRRHGLDLRPAGTGLVRHRDDQVAGVGEEALRDRPRTGDVRLDQVDRPVARQHVLDRVGLGGAAPAAGLPAATGQQSATGQGGGAEAEQGEESAAVGDPARMRWVHATLPSIGGVCGAATHR